VEDEWDIIRQSAETPGIRTNWFFLYILSNILRRPVVMHGQVCVSDDEQVVSALKMEMRGIFLPSLMHPDDCHKTPIVVGYT
ncbi:unnamed protein product, partial [Ascophyllum nodosum]